MDNNTFASSLLNLNNTRNNEETREFASFFYYHPKNNPFNIEYCVYYTLSIPIAVIDLWESDNNLYNEKIKNILDGIYKLFEMDSENNITFENSILSGKIHNKYDIIDFKNINGSNNGNNNSNNNGNNNSNNNKNRSINSIFDIVYRLNKRNSEKNIREWGVKYSMESPWSSNIKSILKRVGLDYFTRVEVFTRGNVCNSSSNQYYLKNYEPIIHQDISFLNSIVDNILPVLSSSVNDLEDGYQIVPLSRLENINKEWNLALDKDDINWYKELYNDLEREPTKAEIYDLAQSNSEHSRHWIFNSCLVTDNGVIKRGDRPLTLFKLVKDPLRNNKNNSRLAFCDNASCINGFNCMQMSYNNLDNIIRYENKKVNPTLTAETHNFPTGIAPFQGATTGVGGRIRDTLAIGRGGDIVSSLAGYCVGNLHIPNYVQPWEQGDYNINLNSLVNSSLDILIKASNGASDYGNKVGEPIIGGFMRTFGDSINKIPYHFFKPIMFSAGIGTVLEENTDKCNASNDSINWIVCQVGGPAYPIGLGGGSSSSLGQSHSDLQKYQNAVQRGDPEMETRVINFIRKVVNLVENPIFSIHDQGAGGPANVIKEIIEPIGGDIDISAIPRGDKTMSFLQTWCSEFQEQMTFLINEKDYTKICDIGRRENVAVYKVGYINNTGNVRVIDSNISNNRVAVELPLERVLSNVPQKSLYIRKNNDDSFNYNVYNVNFPPVCFNKALELLLSLPSIASKKFLTNKVDRSVSGLIAQQQCVGPNHLPLSDYSLTALDYMSKCGVASSIGEGSIVGFVDYSIMARRVVGEMLTNLVGVKIESLESVKCSANWMWSPRSSPEQAHNMYEAMLALSSICCDLGIAIDGGKDSVSMHSIVENISGEKCKVLSPPTLVLTSYAPVNDINKKVTPDLKEYDSYLIYIPFDTIKSCGRLGGSAYQQVTNTINSIYINDTRKINISNASDISDINYFKKAFNVVQYLVDKDYILSCHDISDGGLLITMLEMAFTGNKGFDSQVNSDKLAEEFWFSEDMGVVVEVSSNNYKDVIDYISKYSLEYDIVGISNDENSIEITYNNMLIVENSMTNLRYIWEKPSFELEKRQTMLRTLIQEEELSKKISNIEYVITDKVFKKLNNIIIDKQVNNSVYRHKLAVLREVGSNGHREMISAFYQAGFEVSEITMQDIIDKTENLDDYRGLVLVGGFSYGDVPAAGIGWAATLTQNKIIKEQLERFKSREDTFSLGICNGCQVMSHIGWVEGGFSLQSNISKRFESRWAYVRIPKNNNIFLSNLEGCRLGIWVAHGEGQFVFNDYNKLDKNQICCQYVNNDGNPTMDYPLNPNGSVDGIAGLSSLDGRHLIMMPHPERCFLDWQMPYQDIEYKINKKINNWVHTPWFLMFKNAADWCSTKLN